VKAKRVWVVLNKEADRTFLAFTLQLYITI